LAASCRAEDEDGRSPEGPEPRALRRHRSLTIYVHARRWRDDDSRSCVGRVYDDETMRARGTDTGSAVSGSTSGVHVEGCAMSQCCHVTAMTICPTAANRHVQPDVQLDLSVYRCVERQPCEHFMFITITAAPNGGSALRAAASSTTPRGATARTTSWPPSGAGEKARC